MDEKKIEEVMALVYEYADASVEICCANKATDLEKAHNKALQANHKLRQLLGEQHG